MKRPKGAPRRMYPTAPLPAEHVCPVCRCHIVADQRIQAIMANSQQMAMELRIAREQLRGLRAVARG